MFEPNAHVGEDAELYALGQLDSNGSARLERHASVCGECARRVGEAESTVLRLVEAQASQFPVPTLQPFRVRGFAPAWWPAAAIAAAFALGLLPWLAGLRSPAPSQEQVAASAMLHSHFQHAQFVADAPDAPSAKVIYGRTGGWIYVLAAPGSAPLSVVAVKDGVKTTVATLAAGTHTRAAYVALSGAVDAVLLMEGTRQLAHARVLTRR